MPRTGRNASPTREIRERLIELRDDAYLAKIGELVPSTDNIIGVRVPAIRALVKEYAAEHPELTPEDACALLDELCADRCREEMLFGIFLVTRFRRKLGASIWPRIDRWADALDNWETCDQLAMNIAGELVARDVALIDELIAWTASPNPWRRRCAAASTSVLNQKGRRMAVETLRVCEPLMLDADPSVGKAVAWAIREATESDPDAAQAFLRRWKGRAPRRIFREACGKLPEEVRADLLDDGA